MDKVPTPPLFMLRLITCSDDVGKTDYRVAMRLARPGAPTMETEDSFSVHLTTVYQEVLTYQAFVHSVETRTD